MLAETAFAKVNLALHVRDRRPDGYHALESLFVFAKDGDLLSGSLGHGEEISLTLDGPFGKALGSGTDNLVMKAARALQERLGEARGAALKLTKKPAGSIGHWRRLCRRGGDVAIAEPAVGRTTPRR